MHTFYLHGYFGFGNLGDSLLLETTMHLISRAWPNARFRVRTMGDQPLPPALALRSQLTGVSAALMPRHGRPRWRNWKAVRVVAYLRAVNRAMAGSDVFVLAGGTLVHVRQSHRALVLLVALVALARLRGRRVVAVGLGTRGIAGWRARWLVGLLARMMEDIAVRDAASAGAFPAWAPVRLTADLAYALPRLAATPAEDAEAMAQRCLTVSLSAPWPAAGAAPAFNGALRKALLHFVAKGWGLRFIIFQDANEAQGGLSDRQSVAQLMGGTAESLGGSEDDAERWTVVAPTTETGAIQAAYAGSTVHLGARFHGLVLASLLDIPFVGIDIDPKIASLAKTFDMPSIATSVIEAGPIVSAVEAAAGRAIATETVASLARAAEENACWFETVANTGVERRTERAAPQLGQGRS